MRIAAFALALGASAALTAPAMAQETDTRTVRVKVTDEDFASSDSIANLQRQIRRAARKVCVRADNSAAPSSEEQACVAKAIEGAQVELAAVKARYGIALGG